MRGTRVETWSEGGIIVAGGTVADMLICIKCPEKKRNILQTFGGKEWKEERNRKHENCYWKLLAEEEQENK